MEEEKLTMSLYRICKYIEDTIKEHGYISQFKEDVLYVINELLAKPIKVSPATEIVVRNEEIIINKMLREKDEEHIRKLKCKIDDLEKEKQADKEKIKVLEEEIDDWKFTKNYVEDNYIHKNEIKRKIEEFKQVRDEILREENEFNKPMMTYDLKRNDYCEKMLQSLLEKED